MTKELEILKNIQRVDAPAGLYENILHLIESKKREKIYNKWIFALAASVVVVFCLDIFVVVKKSESKEEELAGLHQLFNETNQLYYESR